MAKLPIIFFFKAFKCFFAFQQKKNYEMRRACVDMDIVYGANKCIFTSPPT